MNKDDQLRLPGQEDPTLETATDSGSEQQDPEQPPAKVADNEGNLGDEDDEDNEDNVEDAEEPVALFADSRPSVDDLELDDDDDPFDAPPRDETTVEEWGHVLLPNPPALDDVSRSPRRSRFVGASLGGAIGDAMGHPTEFISSVSAIKERYGPDGVRGYELYWERDGQRFAPYTDDTQMAEVVFRVLLWSRVHDAGLDETMKRMADGFVQWADRPQGGHRAPGNACLSGCRALARGVAWDEAGGPTAGGCGSVMRAYPFGIVFCHDLARAERWAVAHSKLTHRDPIALAACAAMAIGMARICRDEPLTMVLSEMVAAACRYSPRTAAMMARAIQEAEDGVAPDVTLTRLQAWAAHEAIAAAVYLLARHPDDPRAAILEGANTEGDSDSIATLGGALVGARAGVSSIPRDWIDDVERSSVFVQLGCAAADGLEGDAP